MRQSKNAKRATKYNNNHHSAWRILSTDRWELGAQRSTNTQTKSNNKTKEKHRNQHTNKTNTKRKTTNQAKRNKREIYTETKKHTEKQDNKSNENKALCTVCETWRKQRDQGLGTTRTKQEHEETTKTMKDTNIYDNAQHRATS